MFIGEFLCCLPLIWGLLSRPGKEGETVASRLFGIFGYGNTRGDYRPVDDQAEENEDLSEDALTGWRVCWMWFPAFFDSES